MEFISIIPNYALAVSIAMLWKTNGRLDVIINGMNQAFVVSPTSVLLRALLKSI
jgi:hypothetical protein